MFDFFRKHTRLLQFILVLLVFPSFVFFGIQGYTRFTEGGNATVAKVDGHGITQAEWDAAHRNEVERFRAQMPNIDIRLLDTPQMRQQTLDTLVRQRVLLAAAKDEHLLVTDARMQQMFATDPQFAFLRNPDGSLNRTALAQQGMSPEVFEQRLRQELSMHQVMAGIGATALASPAVAAAALDPMFQQREVQVQRFDVKDYLPKVSPTDADIEAFYKDPANAAQFQAPEQATIEYLVLDLEAVKKTITVAEADLRKYYDENASRYAVPEQRKVSHILVKVDKKASADQVAAAKAKADKLLEQVRKNPASFAEVAKANSEDPGSAPQGGSLDFLGRGDTLKPFEDAAFGAKVGDIVGPVRTDEGWHLIQVQEARGGEKRPFEAVRGELENEVRNQLAQKKFAEMAVDFTNTVYEQSDSLKPAADKFKLEIKTAQNVRRTPAPGTEGPLASPKLLDALFSSDSVRTKRNTDAVEVGPNQLVSARIVQYAPARTLPLADVKEQVRSRVATAQAVALARKEGEARLAALKAAPQTAMDAPVTLVSRAQAKDIPSEVLQAVLRAPTDKLPSVVGVELPGAGYAVVRVNKVLGRDPASGDVQRAQAQYERLWGDAEMAAYYDALKRRYKVEITGKAASASTAPADAGAKGAER